MDALEFCSGKASSAVIMKKARMRMGACGSLRLRQVEGSFGAIDESNRAAKVVKDIRRPPAQTRICLRSYQFEGILIGISMSRIMNIVLLREMADKAITISTRGLAGARRPKHANMTISQNTSILRKGLAIEL